MSALHCKLQEGPVQEEAAGGKKDGDTETIFVNKQATETQKQTQR